MDRFSAGTPLPIAKKSFMGPSNPAGRSWRGAGLSIKDFGHLKRGAASRDRSIETTTNGTEQRPTAFYGHDGDAKLLYAWKPGRTITLAWQRSRQFEVPRYDKYESGRAVRWIFDPQERDLAYGTFVHVIKEGWIDRFRGTLSWQRQAEAREIQSDSLTLITREKDATITRGASLQGEKLLSGHELTFGGDAYFDRVDSDRFFIEPVTGSRTDDIRGRFPDDARYENLGIFLRDEYRLLERWTASAGTRAGRFEAEFRVPEGEGGNGGEESIGDVEQSFHALSSSASLTFEAGDHLMLSAGLSQGFRAPNLSDLAKLGESKGTTFEVPNHGLRPEKLISYDLGARYAGRKIEGNAAIYYAAIRDLIATGDTTWNGSPTIEINGDLKQIRTKKNLGDGFLRGIEVELRYLLARS